VIVCCSLSEYELQLAGEAVPDRLDSTEAYEEFQASSAGDSAERLQQSPSFSDPLQHTFQRRWREAAMRSGFSV
jgi:hypothetical protein